MKVKCKINSEKDDHDNYEILVNRIIKAIKENKTEKEQNETPVLELFNNMMTSLSMNDWIEVPLVDKFFLDEIIEQIVEHDWHPESKEDIEEYLELRKNLVIPIMEEGTMEYKLLKMAYDQIDIDYLYLTAVKVAETLIWKTKDYHELPTEL